MSVVIEARDHLVEKLYSLEPGSTEMLQLTQVIRTLSDIDLDDRRFEFDVNKEETRKLERSNDIAYSELDTQLKKIDIGIRLLNVLLEPGANIFRTLANNKVRIRRDIMGYQYEETGVIGSHTFTNAQKDRYD